MTSNPIRLSDFDYILAVDPGEHTGWADCYLPKLEIKSGMDDDQQRFVGRAEDWMRWRQHKAIIVVERFTVTEKTAQLSQQPSSMEIIGALRYLAGKYRCLLAPLQAPGDAKRFVTNDRLRQVKLYDKNEHARDALRHLLLFLVNQGDRRVLEMIK